MRISQNTLLQETRDICPGRIYIKSQNDNTHQRGIPFVLILTCKLFTAREECQDADDHQSTHIQQAHYIDQQVHGIAARKAADQANNNTDQNQPADLDIRVILTDMAQ